ncbi:MAG: VWA domain-containing protein [Lachnospiraceae bacterium]|nr:VWA domain-containing protein [Lachnospiraceae bacterium]MDY5701704.1 VWA domain-containing protein [Lachnospiraceae bacterium]
MGITNANKEISKTEINCGESFQVTLSLAAQPDITNNPTDIILILDRSGSMAGSPLANLKSGAKKFIDIIDEATDSSQDGQIGGGSHIGIVSFSSTATKDTQLITSVSDLKAAVNSLSAGGSTNHEDAFTKALELFDMASSNAKVMVMFTDGMTTAGGNPNTVATTAKALGISIYVIGLSGNGGLDEQALKDWASDPDSAFLAITPDDAELEDLFENLARNITKPGATDIVIKDQISPCFKITALSSPTKGQATLLNSNLVQWKISSLGSTKTEGASLTFTVSHEGVCTGEVEVNESISYSDHEGNIVIFPSPTIQIDCGTEIIGEDCPDIVSITIDGCEDTIEFNAGDLELESLGRILQLDVTLKNICPNKRVALAIILNEVDEYDNEYKRGLKTLTIPAHHKSSCQDITVRCIKFVLPQDLDVSTGCSCICNERKLVARLIAHYVDHDFECCDVVTTTHSGPTCGCSVKTIKINK